MAGPDVARFRGVAKPPEDAGVAPHGPLLLTPVLPAVNTAALTAVTRRQEVATSATLTPRGPFPAPVTTTVQSASAVLLTGAPADVPRTRRMAAAG